MQPITPDHIRSLAHTRIEPTADMAAQICAVAAPTGAELERARFVATLWHEQGYTPELDDIGNVYVQRGQADNGPLLLLLAHTDTVFPASTPLRVKREGTILRGPGIGDNSLSVAAMIQTLHLLDMLGVETAAPIVAVANVGEEGLGNLRGARAAVERYRERLGAVIAIDGDLGHITHRAVGSSRWRIVVCGPGGHSYGNFGVPSAIHGLARIIAHLADLTVPKDPKTTFNVGVIEGGTSVNTIASTASALLDMRSIDMDALRQLENQARHIIERSAGQGLSVEIEVLGERPAGEIHYSAPLVRLCADILRWLGREPSYSASSTDANIPLSLGIPAVCIGVAQSERVHTVEEFLHIPPIGDGLAQLLRLCIEGCELVQQQRL